MSEFRVGDEVVVVGEHRFSGDLYSTECDPGDLLTVVRVEQFHLNCTRDKARYGDRGLSTLNIDKDCVRPAEPSQDEIIALFGLAPAKSHHCPTCTCNAEEAS